MNNLWYSMSKLEFSKIKKHRHYLWCISIKFYEWIQCNSIFLKFGSILTFLHLFYCNMCIIFHKILFKNLLFPSSYNPLLIDIPAHFNDYFVPPITHFWNFCPPWKMCESNYAMIWFVIYKIPVNLVSVVSKLSVVIKSECAGILFD